MGKLFCLLILVHVSLNSMENDSQFETLKTSVDKALNNCKDIQNNDKRFETWKKEYENLYKILPNTKEELDKLTEKAEEQNYTNPIFLFLVRSKRKNIDEKKEFNMWSFFEKKSSKDIELSPPVTNEQFEKWVKKTAQDYGLILPHTEFAKKLWYNNEKISIIKKELCFSPIKNKNILILKDNSISEEFTPIDLYYFSCLPKKFQTFICSFEKMNLTTIPDNISQLEYLKALLLNGNNLTDLPESLSTLKHLKILALVANNFTQLPKVIREIKSLGALVANQNNLENNPVDIISNLTNLKYLDLSKNKLTNFNFKNLPDSLISLRLDNNQIKKMQPISRTSQLEYVTMHNNPLTNEEYLEALKNLAHLKINVKPQEETLTN